MKTETKVKRDMTGLNLPWEGRQYLLVNKDGETVADFSFWDTRTAAEHIAYAITAVNSHDALLRVCETLEAPPQRAANKEVMVRWFSRYSQTLIEARAALALARRDS